MKSVFAKCASVVLGLIVASAALPASAGQVYSDRQSRSVQTFNNDWALLVSVQPSSSTTSTGQVEVVTRFWYSGPTRTNYMRFRLDRVVSPTVYYYGPTHTLNTTYEYWYNDTVTTSWTNTQLDVTLLCYTVNQYTYTTPYDTIYNDAFDIYYN